jgi:hypothetical protein
MAKDGINIINWAPDSDTIIIEVLKKRRKKFAWRIDISRNEDGVVHVIVTDGDDDTVHELELGVE